MAVFSINALAEKIRDAEEASAAEVLHKRLEGAKAWAEAQPWSDIRELAWKGMAVGDNEALSKLSDLDFLVNRGIISNKDKILAWPFLCSDKDKLLELVAAGKVKTDDEEVAGFW